MTEVALVARAKGLAGHLLARETLEQLSEAGDLGAFARDLADPAAAIDPIANPGNVFAIERAIASTAHRHLQRLYRWQEHTPGVLDVFAAHQDRRSLRTLLRGAVRGAPADERLESLLPTPSLPRLVLATLARQESAADVVRHLVLAAHPEAVRLLPLVHTSQPDLLAIDVALLRGFAQRATRAVSPLDGAARAFVADVIDLGNLQNALLIVRAGRDVEPMDLFIAGGRSLSRQACAAVARADSEERAFITLAAAVATSPLASVVTPIATTAAHLDHAFLAAAIRRLKHAARIEPLSTAPLLHVLLRIEAQSRDLRALAWGAAFATPPIIRRQALVTPS